MKIQVRDIIYIIIIILVMIFFFTREPKVIYKDPIKKYQIIKIDSIVYSYDTITTKIIERIKDEKDNIPHIDNNVELDSLQQLFTRLK